MNPSQSLTVNAPNKIGNGICNSQYKAQGVTNFLNCKLKIKLPKTNNKIPAKQINGFLLKEKSDRPPKNI